VVAVVTAGAVFSGGGCVTNRKYRLVRTETQPMALGLTTETPQAKVTVETVIVCKGPGSWKSEARWDEYVLTISNPGPHPLKISTAELTDVLGQTQRPGSDPWQLEKISRTNWEIYGRMGLHVAEGFGVLTLSAMAGMTGAATLSYAIPVVAVANIAVVKVKSHRLKQRVETEFTRRRLDLPTVMGPGVTATGSLFFPMTPGPRLLRLQGGSDSSPFELVITLTPLGQLHLKTPPV
jgi:hypothetical protein